MSKIFIIILLYLSPIFALANTINITKKAVTISSATNLKEANKIAKRLIKYDIYIYKTTTTKKPYFIIYVVNINKENLKLVINDIKKDFPDVYASSNKRIKSLSTNNFNKNIFIASSKKEIKIKNISKNISKKINKQSISTIEKKKLIIDTHYQINYKQKAILLGYFKNNTEADFIMNQYKQYDIYTHSDHRDKEFCCAIYIVNINRKDYNTLFYNISKTQLNPQRISSIMIKYISKDKLLKTQFIPAH